EGAGAGPHQHPGGVVLLAAAALHLIGDAAAVAAERTRLPAERTQHRAPPQRQPAMAAEAFVAAHAAPPACQPPGRCAANGNRPRPSVISPMSRMQAPASRTPCRRQAGASMRPRPPIISIAGKVPSPNAAMVRAPGSAPAVLA